MSSTPKKIPADSDLLLPFEQHSFSKEYLEYYKIRRTNLFASIQYFSPMWEYFMLLDKVWLRGIQDLYTAKKIEHMFPCLLFINAHSKIRLGIELTFSACLPEARSLLRDALEFVVHAHAMLADPPLQKIWLSKNDGKPDLEVFKDAFDRNKRKSLFKGLEQLHTIWCELSETGSHANLSAMADRFKINETATHLEYKISYTGATPDYLEKSVYLMLQYCTLMEEVFFNDYYTRLNLDIDLVRMRREAKRMWEEISRNLIKKYHLKPPVAPPTKP
jgi:hypothetical protein